MNVLFYGFRHGHIFGCYRKMQEDANFKILGALEENEEARIAAQKQGVNFSSGNYETWLQDPEVEAVAIGGAYGDRGAAIIKALEMGKHIIADKPICTSLAQLEQIRRLALEKERIIFCLLDLRYTKSAVCAKALFKSGEMGAVKNVIFTGQHCIDYKNRPGWYFEAGKHGGTINDIAVHGVDLLSYLTGERIGKAHCVRTWNSYAVHHPEFKDCAMFMAETETGAGVMADVSYSAPSQVFSMPTYWNFQIWCEKGLVTFCCVNDEVTVYMDGEDNPRILPGQDPKETLLQDFYRQVQQGDMESTRHLLDITKTVLRLQEEADGRN